MPRFSDEELDKLLKTLPPDLKTAVFSEETAHSIRRICERNKIEEEDVPYVATITGNVLIGITPPEEFPKALQEGLGIDEAKAQRVSNEANRLIFYPVGDSLGKLYGKAKPAEGKEEKEAGTAAAEAAEKPKEAAPAGAEPAKKITPGPDVYREPVEME